MKQCGLSGYIRDYQDLFKTHPILYIVKCYHDLFTVGDDAELLAAVDRALTENPDLVDSYRKGKLTVEKALMGKAMDFLTLTEKGAGMLFGETQGDNWAQDDNGQWLHTLAYPSASVVFVTDANRANPLLESLSITGGDASGPRGLTVGMPEARIPIAQAIIAICLAEKSNSVVTALDAAMADAEKGGFSAVPDYLRDQSYQIPHAKTPAYQYPHDFPGHYVRQTYMPQGYEDHGTRPARAVQRQNPAEGQTRRAEPRAGNGHSSNPARFPLRPAFAAAQAVRPARAGSRRQKTSPHGNLQVAEVHNLDQACVGGNIVVLAHENLVDFAAKTGFEHFAVGQSHQPLARRYRFALAYVNLTHRSGSFTGHGFIVHNADRSAEAGGIADAAFAGGIAVIRDGCAGGKPRQYKQPERACQQYENNQPCCFLAG